MSFPDALVLEWWMVVLLGTFFVAALMGAKNAERQRIYRHHRRLLMNDNPYTADPDLIGVTFDELLTKLRDTRQALRNHLQGGVSNAELYAATLPECKPNE